MSVVNIKDYEITDTLIMMLKDYGQDVADLLKDSVDVVSKDVNETIKNHVTFKGTKYVKAFRVKTSYEDRYNKRNTWYVAKPYYRLTHLLENGHATINGDRTREFPHIKYGEELAKKRMEELAKEAVENANRR